MMEIQISTSLVTQPPSLVALIGSLEWQLEAWALELGNLGLYTGAIHSLIFLTISKLFVLFTSVFSFVKWGQK